MINNGAKHKRRNESVNLSKNFTSVDFILLGITTGSFLKLKRCASKRQNLFLTLDVASLPSFINFYTMELRQYYTNKTKFIASL